MFGFELAGEPPALLLQWSPAGLKLFSITINKKAARFFRAA
jgi:hypothetical protein